MAYRFSSDASERAWDAVVDPVVERGWDERQESADEYAFLLSKVEYRTLVTYQLYDAYFPPGRHEFELRWLEELVKQSTMPYLAGAMVGGIVGNAAYDVLKHSLLYLAKKLRPLGARSYNAAKKMLKNARGINEFFKTREKATLREVCDAIRAEPDEVVPLLMLLGYRRVRKTRTSVWTPPISETAPDPKGGPCQR